MLLYENLLCIYDVIMIYLKICWFYFSFVFFLRLIQTWNIQRLIGGTSHWNKIWMSTSTVQKTWLFIKKKIKKNRQLTILLEIPNLSHTVNIKKWGKGNWSWIFSAEICTWMHLKFDFVRFFKYIKYCLEGGGMIPNSQIKSTSNVL